jgi:hypothetical protein
MFPTLYLPYVVFTVWALLRTRCGASRASRLKDWWFTAVAMAALPIVIAAAAFAVATQTENGVAVVLSFYVPGGLMLIAGLAPGETIAAAWRRWLRICGWSLIAGMTLVPSWLLIFVLPLVGLLAFLVPGGYEGSASPRGAGELGRGGEHAMVTVNKR